jgi:hypothetical protein
MQDAFGVDREQVAKFDKSNAAAGTAVGAGAATGAVLGSRAVWNSDHLPLKALNAPERALRRGRHPGPMVRARLAVDAKGKATPIYQMVAGKAPSRLEGMARHIPSGVGRLGLLSKPKTAGVVVGTSVVAGGAAGMAHGRNKDTKVHL